MNRTRVVVLACMFAAGFAAWGQAPAELPLFDVGRTDLPGSIANPGECESVEFQGSTYLKIAPETDPYTPRTYRIVFPATLLSALENPVLEVAFYDGGAGLIQPGIRVGKERIGLGRQQSYTRLNTQQKRKA
ncbi:MAG: hypothetical protein WC655_11215, partial [Candidatus Hydrogenedentales bacterium]